MKSYLSLPSNRDFFARYANLVPTLFKVGILSQVISAVTEIGIIFSIAYASLENFLPQAYHAEITAGLAAFIGTGLLEIGLRKFVPYSVKAFLYKRFKGLDRAMTIFILVTACGLLFMSGTLSFRNSPKIIETLKPHVEQKDLKPTTAHYNNERSRILVQYRADSSATASSYAVQINAKIREYKSRIDVLGKDIERYKRKEQRTGQSHRTKKIMIAKAIEQLEADRDGKISVLTGYKSKDLQTLLTKKNEAISHEKTRYEQNILDVKTFNKKEQEKADQQIQTYGGGLGWFTVFCLIIFVLSVILHEIHKKGSGIEEQVLPSQYDFSTGIIADFLNALNNKIQYKLRSKIARWEGNTPPPPLPIPPTSLYSLSELNQEIITIKVTEQPDNAKVIYLPNENRYNDFRKENESNDNRRGNLRTCEHCSNEYVYKHHKQKYCSDNCRIKAWEKRTGCEMKKRKSK